jgi:hypothetical protein
MEMALTTVRTAIEPTMITGTTLKEERMVTEGKELHIKTEMEM